MHKEATLVELSVIERDTLQALSEGLKWEGIAERLQQGSPEVKNAARRAYAKLGAHQLKAVRKAISLGIIAGPEIPHATLRRLTKRQWQICKAIHEGLTNIEIGNRLSITESTAKTHVQQILAKLGAHNRCHLAAIVELMDSGI